MLTFLFESLKKYKVGVWGHSDTLYSYEYKHDGKIGGLNVQLTTRAFQFAIRIDSIRYANRFESIRFVKKIGLSIH